MIKVREANRLFRHFEHMKITGAKTKGQVIREALEDQIKRRKRLMLLTFKGKIDLNIDLDSLRDR